MDTLKVSFYSKIQRKTILHGISMKYMTFIERLFKKKFEGQP